MYRIVSGITSPHQHRDTLIRTPERYHPPQCPHCGLDRLWRHGCYARKGDRGRALDPIAIPRFSCRGCHRTCSRLPACIAPRRWHDWSIQQHALQRRLAGVSVHAASRLCGLARRTVRRWWQWLMAQSRRFSFHLRARMADLGRAADDTALWLMCFTYRSLSEAMAVLDADGVSVP